MRRKSCWCCILWAAESKFAFAVCGKSRHAEAYFPWVSQVLKNFDSKIFPHIHYKMSANRNYLFLKQNTIASSCCSSKEMHSPRLWTRGSLLKSESWNANFHLMREIYPVAVLIINAAFQHCIESVGKTSFFLFYEANLNICKSS